jgi:hypothetical protein
LRRPRAGVRIFGGVPKSILYDNTKLAVARIVGDGPAAADVMQFYSGRLT